MTSHKLTKGIIELGGDIRYLVHQARYMEPTKLDQEIRRYQRILQAIYLSAEKQNIDLLPYYDALAEINANLKMIKTGVRTTTPLEKIALFIDGANLSKMVRAHLALDVDYAKILTYFSRDASILRAYYYTGVENEDEVNTNRFLFFLKRSGYQLVTKQIKTYADGERKGNLDIEIALDMLELAEKVDRVVLFSGDGDFAPLLKRIGKKGVRTEVVSYVSKGKNPTASELLDVTDIFINLADIINQISLTERT